MAAKSHASYLRNRDYYLAREASPEGKQKRAERQKARRDAVRDGRLDGPKDPREVDHKKALSKGGSNAKSNTQILSRTANRKKFT